MKFNSALFEDVEVEFYKNEDEFKVNYKNKEYSLKDFLKLRIMNSAVNTIIEKMVAWAKKNFKLSSYDETDIVKQLFAQKNDTPDVHLTYDGISFDFKEAMNTSAGRLGSTIKSVVR